MPKQSALGEMLTALVESIPHEQSRLDVDYLARLQEYREFLRVARAQELEALAHQFAPSSIRITETDLDLQFRFARSRDQASSLVVEPINLGYQRRYGYSEFGRHRLRLTVRQTPVDIQKPKP